MKHLAFLFLSLSLLCTLDAQAQKRARPTPPANKQACADLQTQSGMNQCAYDGYQKADAELNKVYQQLLPKIDPSRLEKFKAAQRAWVALRDADCEYEASDSEGGTMEPLLRYSCFETATKARTAHLRAILKDLTSR